MAGANQSFHLRDFPAASRDSFGHRCPVLGNLLKFLSGFCQRRFALRVLFRSADHGINVSRLQFDQPCLAAMFLPGDQSCSRSPEGVQHSIAALATVLDRALDQLDRLLRWTQDVGSRLVYEPDIALIPRASPEVIRSLPPPVEERFILALVIRAAVREPSFAQITNVDQCPPAAVNAFCSV
jgi:hypothetical protein